MNPTLKYATFFERLFNRPLFYFALPTATPAGEASVSSDSHIDSLLGADLGTTETAETAGEDTSVAGGDVAVEEEPDATATETEAEPDAEDAEGAAEVAEGEEEAGDEELSLDELETDFSDATYAKAADHWKKRGVELDPANAGHRAFLKDWMERGQKIAELQAGQAEEPEEEAAEPAAKDAPPAKTPQEQFKERLAGAREYAKANIVPEVAMEFSKGIVDALWPGKDVKLTQEQANSLATTFSTFAIMQIADAIPSILGAAPKSVANAYPHFERMHDMATREAAVDELMNATDKATGQASFPRLEQLVESGAIKRAMNGPDLKDAVFSKDPYKNLVAKLRMAYKLANNERVNPALLEKAVQRGKELANTRNRSVAAGRLPPGKTRSGAAPSSGPSGFMQTLVAGSESKFGRALAEARRNRSA
jgi:hypothetical protein